MVFVELGLENVPCLITAVETKKGTQNIYTIIHDNIQAFINAYFEDIKGNLYRIEFINQLYNDFKNLNKEIFRSEYKFTELEIDFIINCYPSFFLTIIHAILLDCEERDRPWVERLKRKKKATRHVRYKFGYIH